MAELVWNEGMSVGIEAIDNDHKKIIELLARLANAHVTQLSEQAIGEIFVELERYVAEHFTREEALLEKIGYSDLIDHKKSHQAFVERIPMLRKEWLESNSFETTEKINAFLHQWLINHILVEDMDYVSAVHLHQQRSKKASVSTLFNNIAAGLSRKIRLSRRVFLTTFVPVLGVLAFCGAVLWGNYQQLNNTQLLLGLNTVLTQVNELVHTLQSERGLSSGYASSNYQYFGEQLRDRRSKTDEFIGRFYLLLDQEISNETQENMSFYAQSVRDNLSQLQQHRMLIDQGKEGFSETYHTYTSLILQLLTISENLVHIDMTAKVANDLSAINSLLFYKEYAGQMRAIGMDMTEAGATDLYQDAQMSLLIGQHLNVLHSFEIRANNSQKSICAELCNGQLQLQKIRDDFIVASQKDKSQSRAQYWFDQMSDHIDTIHLVSNALIEQFTDEMVAEHKQLQQQFIFILLLLSLVVLLTVGFSVALNRSIISPIRRITGALDEMAKGHKNIQFKDVLGNDEIGAIHQAYEKLRRKFLQADIFQSQLSRQQKVNEYRKNQQQHFQQLAHTDSLTGAVNRHHFNQVLAQELAIADQVDSPLSIMFLDIDHFKRINDTYGHAIGDEVLISFYQACKNELRSSDVAARVGGEEFVIVMPKTDLHSAQQLAERMRASVEKMAIDVEQNVIQLTVSIGVTQWNSHQFSSAEALVEHVDKALYQAKKLGRNKVVLGQVADGEIN